MFIEKIGTIISQVSNAFDINEVYNLISQH